MTLTGTAPKTTDDDENLYVAIQPNAELCQASYGLDAEMYADVNNDTYYVNGIQDFEPQGKFSEKLDPPEEFVPGTYRLCAWLEDGDSDEATPSPFPASKVSLKGVAVLTYTNPDTLTGTLSAPSVAADGATPVTATFSGTATTVDGDAAAGPFLFVTAQPSTDACAASYGADLTAYGAGATTVSTFTEVAAGAYTTQVNYVPGAAGSYVICSWLEFDPNDAANANIPANEVFAAGAALSLTATAPAPPPPPPAPAPAPAPKPAAALSGAKLSGVTGAHPKLSFTATAKSGKVTTIKVKLPAGVSAAKKAKTLAKDITVKAGKKKLKFSATGGSTVTIKLKTKASKVTVSIAKALTETKSLRSKIHKKKIKKLSFKFSISNSAGGTLAKTAKLKV